ncbi:unnamed protein product [Brassica oleracea var. botrytis]
MRSYPRVSIQLIHLLPTDQEIHQLHHYSRSTFNTNFSLGRRWNFEYKKKLSS